MGVFFRPAGRFEMEIEMGQSETSRQPQIRMSAVELRRKRQKEWQNLLRTRKAKSVSVGDVMAVFHPEAEREWFVWFGTTELF